MYNQLLGGGLLYTLQEERAISKAVTSFFFKDKNGSELDLREGNTIVSVRKVHRLLTHFLVEQLSVPFVAL